MASRNFKLSVDVESRKAERDLKKFNKTLDDTNKKQKENSKETKNAKGGMAGFAGALSGVARKLGPVGLGLTGATAALVAMNAALLNSATRIRELETAALVADTTVGTLQAIGIEANKMGVNLDKVGDLIQDINDKFGDFVTTGAGPFKDFFETIGPQVGITAEQFAGLPGPEKAILIADALKQVGASAESTAFFTEAFGSDFNRLIGIFENGGRAFKETEDRLRRLGAITSKEDRDAIKDYADEVNILGQQWNALKDDILAEVAPALKVLVVNAQEFVAWLRGGDDSTRTTDSLKTELEEVNNTILEMKANGEDTVKVLEQGVFGGPKRVSKPNEEYLEQLERQKELEDEIEKRRQANAQAQAERDEKQNNAKKELLNNQNNLNKAEREAAELLSKKTTQDLETRLQLAKDLNGAYMNGYQVGQDMLEQNKLSLEYSRLKVLLEDKKVENAQELLDLLKETQDLEADTARLSRFRGKEQQLRRELELLNATTDAARERVAFEHEIQDLNIGAGNAETLRALNEQIIARQQHLDMLEKEKEAVQDLAEAMGRWASGSEDAVKQVIAQLIRLIAIKAFGGTGTFLGGFLQGFGSGGINGYADGGSFRSGETFMVGERGPEIITASAPGMVIPNHQLGGGSTIVVNNNMSINGGVNGTEEIGQLFQEFSSEIAVQTQNMIKRQLTPRGVLA